MNKIKNILIVVIICMAVALLVSCNSLAKVTPEQKQTATPSLTATASLTVTASPTSTPTFIPTPYVDIQATKSVIRTQVAVINSDAISYSSTLSAKYNQAVYNDPNVDSAMKQLVRGNDFIVAYFGILVEQNAELLKLIAEMP